MGTRPPAADTSPVILCCLSAATCHYGGAAHEKTGHGHQRGGWIMLLGIQDPWVALAYILCILSALLCVVWGIANWNKEGPEEPPEEIKQWAEEEDQVEKEL
jgi:hypothetical protein